MTQPNSDNVHRDCNVTVDKEIRRVVRDALKEVIESIKGSEMGVDMRDNATKNMDVNDAEFDDSFVEVSEWESELGSDELLLDQVRTNEDISSPHLHAAKSYSQHVIEEEAKQTTSGGMQPEVGADFLTQNGDNGLKDTSFAHSCGILPMESNDNLQTVLKRAETMMKVRGHMEEFY